MGKENERSFQVDKLKSGKWWHCPFFILVLGITEIGNSQAVKVTFSPTPSTSKFVHQASNKSLVVHRHKRGDRDKGPIGLSSANVPEKYVRTVMFEIPEGLWPKYGAPLAGKKVDGQENVYFVFQRAVVELDKNGKEIRVFNNSMENSWKSIFVDESGNLLIWERKLENNHAVNGPGKSQIRVFDSKGKLIDQPIIEDWQALDKSDVHFSHGIVFSIKTGEKIYKMPDADEKMISNLKTIPLVKHKFKENPPRHLIKNNGSEYNFPDLIDGCEFGEITDVDSFGNFYVTYEEVTEVFSEGADYPSHNFTPHTYKFDSECHLLGGFDFVPDAINQETSDVYHLETGSSSWKFVKWELSVKQ